MTCLQMSRIMVDKFNHDNNPPPLEPYYIESPKAMEVHTCSRHFLA